MHSKLHMLLFESFIFSGEVSTSLSIRATSQHSTGACLKVLSTVRLVVLLLYCSYNRRIFFPDFISCMARGERAGAILTGGDLRICQIWRRQGPTNPSSYLGTPEKHQRVLVLSRRNHRVRTICPQIGPFVGEVTFKRSLSQ